MRGMVAACSQSLRALEAAEALAHDRYPCGVRFRGREATKPSVTTGFTVS
jgi:hypothetical protein